MATVPFMRVANDINCLMNKTIWNLFWIVKIFQVSRIKLFGSLFPVSLSIQRDITTTTTSSTTTPLMTPPPLQLLLLLLLLIFKNRSLHQHVWVKVTEIPKKSKLKCCWWHTCKCTRHCRGSSTSSVECHSKSHTSHFGTRSNSKSPLNIKTHAGC